jgi:CubicO group peptidase (beta-lactamase class C family)
MTTSRELDTVPASVELLLRKLFQSNSASKPRALITDLQGETLLASGETSLPVALMEVTNLFTLAMILREFDRGAMTPETPIADLLPEDMIRGLCVINGVDHRTSITVDHLIRHTSGITDYFAPPGRQTLSLRYQTRLEDRSWSTEQALEIARHYPGQFTPGASKKIGYSHTNYLLLGEILKESTGMSFEQLVNLRVVTALGLRDTYVFTPRHFERYFSIAPIIHEGTAQRTPQSLASFGPSGSVVSTSRDVTRFLRGFWNGELCGQQWHEELLSDPVALSRGVTIARGVLVVPRRGGVPPLIGHTGSSGSVALIDTKTGSVGFATTNSTTPQPTLVRQFASVITRLSPGD